MRIFETERLLIRELEADDIPYLYAYGKEDIVVQYQSWGPTTLADSEQFYLRSVQARKSEVRKDFTFGVILHSSGQLIGDCGYHFENDTRNSVELGYNLHPDYWQQGYGTEMLTHLVKYMRSKHEGLSIYAECDSRNTASRRLLEKIGFELVEVRKGDLMQRGTLIDTCRYCLNN